MDTSDNWHTVNSLSGTLRSILSDPPDLLHTGLCP